jgi:hypothetical protein
MKARSIMFLKKPSKKLGKFLDGLEFLPSDDGKTIIRAKVPSITKNPDNISLNDTEQEAYDNFYNKHKHGTVHLHMVADSGLGRNWDVRCTHCKKTQDITDYSCW